MWDKMHTERTNMLWSKEEYLNSMHSYQQILNKMKLLDAEVDLTGKDEDAVPQIAKI